MRSIIDARVNSSAATDVDPGCTKTILPRTFAPHLCVRPAAERFFWSSIVSMSLDVSISCAASAIRDYRTNLAYKENLANCGVRTQNRRSQLAGGPGKVIAPECLKLSLGWRRYKHDLKIQSEVNPQRLVSGKLLDHKTYFPRTPSIECVLSAWTDNPFTTVAVDFDYNTYLLGAMKHEAIFEIALANARGDWIVPPRSMNHGISILELCEKGNFHLRSLKDTHKCQIKANTPTLVELAGD